MTTIFNILFDSYKKVYGAIIGGAIFCFYFFIRKNSKLEENNKNLKTNLEELNIESAKIISIQRKQNDIASAPPLSRDDLHKWMRNGGKNTPTN
jgi:hypothetical protein